MLLLNGLALFGSQTSLTFHQITAEQNLWNKDNKKLNKR